MSKLLDDDTLSSFMELRPSTESPISEEKVRGKEMIQEPTEKVSEVRTASEAVKRETRNFTEPKPVRPDKFDMSKRAPGRPKRADNLNRSRHFNMLMRPDTFEGLNILASLDQTSIGNIMNELAEGYLAERKADIAKFKEMQRG